MSYVTRPRNYEIAMYTLSSNNKRIARNTLMLYTRMLIIMGISLFTSRIVLQTLGVSDFGIYQVVGGFVTMLAYLNTVSVNATQRFISFALGKNNSEEQKKTFCTTVIIQYLIAIIILIAAETFGIWFLNARLQIPLDRMFAANCVYQCSVLSLLINVVSVPYNSCIVAHEHMHVYAYISILEAILKLVIVYLIVTTSYDKLIFYAILHLTVAAIIRACYTIYCKRHFEECTYKLTFQKEEFKEMFSYTGWTMLGSLGFSFKDQFSNVIMNLFLGTAVNAARGISMQVNSVVNSFANNFFMALSPQITKQYAAQKVGRSQSLVYISSRFSFYLMLLIAVPIITHVDSLMELWLGVVPKYTSPFVVITLLASLLYSIAHPFTTALQATGNIKWFQIGISIIMLMELPIAWLFLSLSYPPYYAMLPVMVTSLMGIFYRFFLLKKMIPSYSYHVLLFNILLNCTIVFIISLFGSYFVACLFDNNVLAMLVSIVCSVAITTVAIIAFGLSSIEKKQAYQIIVTRLIR